MIPPIVKSMMEAFNLLKDAGFSVEINHEEFSIFGTIQPEHFEKDGFEAIFRDVYVGKSSTGEYYVTSHIYGELTHPDTKTPINTEILNIFSFGPTPLEAVKLFLTRWEYKIYNS
jgi:hypothetical protein